MSTVKVNELHKEDLPWFIEYDESKCVQCGKCTAVCSFGAISPCVELRKKSLALNNNETEKVLVIKQNVDYDHHCVGGYLAYGLFLHNTEYSSDMICWISWLICNHMEPFFNSHYYQDLPAEMKDAIDRIHAADLAAH